MRKVKYKEANKGVWTEGTGWFHQWGVGYEEFESGPAPYTTAIVEDEVTGQVLELMPRWIQFLPLEEAGMAMLVPEGVKIDYSDLPGPRPSITANHENDQ